MTSRSIIGSQYLFPKSNLQKNYSSLEMIPIYFSLQKNSLNTLENTKKSPKVFHMLILSFLVMHKFFKVAIILEFETSCCTLCNYVLWLDLLCIESEEVGSL